MSAYAPPQQGGQQPQAETETVSGQVASVITKGQDKWQIAVQVPGSQYTKNLWTKDAGLVNQMQQAIGQSFDFICGVSHWTGQNGPVRSLWINGLANYGSSPVQQGQAWEQPQGQTAPPPQQYAGQPAQYPAQQQPVYQQPVPQQQPQVQGMPTLSPMEKEERIMREHAMSVAAEMLPYMEPAERNFLGMVTVAEGLIRYYKLGPPPQQAPPQQAPQPSYEQGNQQYENTPPPPSDDDIPWPTA